MIDELPPIRGLLKYSRPAQQVTRLPPPQRLLLDRLVACRASEIRLLGGDKTMLGVMPLTRALDMADEEVSSEFQS